MGTTELALPDGYERVLADVKKAVAAANLRAMRTANTEMLRLYWTIGRAILEQQDQEGWGAKVIGRLAKDLRDAYPGLTGLSRSNLEYMRRYAAAYRSAPIPQQPAGALPWGHVMVLLDKFDSPELRDWYAAQAVDNGWSRAVLLHQIDNLLHTRLGAAPRRRTSQ